MAFACSFFISGLGSVVRNANSGLRRHETPRHLLEDPRAIDYPNDWGVMALVNIGFRVKVLVAADKNMPCVE